MSWEQLVNYKCEYYSGFSNDLPPVNTKSLTLDRTNGLNLMLGILGTFITLVKNSFALS